MVNEAVTVQDKEGAQEVPSEKVPWYTLNPRHLRFNKWSWRFLGVALVLFFCYGFNIKPLWQLEWRTHLFCLEQFASVKSAAGKTFKGGDWVNSREILVYGAPGVQESLVAQAADGMQSIVKELHLDLHVRQVPAPADALRSLAAATIHNSRVESHFDLDKFMERRLDDRGMRYAEMVVVDAQFKDPDWAWGLTYFPTGTAVLQASETTRTLARHEGTHLLGYDRHDDMPWYVFGYPEVPLPAQRDTLMMLLPKKSDQLSSRAHDAVVNFWRGMETGGKHYFITQP